jgi:hypothetical protein
MNHHTEATYHSVLSISVFSLCGLALYHALETVGNQIIADSRWTNFLNWRLPALLVLSSIILVFACRKVSESQRRTVYILDGIVWLSAPVSIMLAAGIPYITNPELLTGVFFLGLWAMKSALVFWTLFHRQHRTPLGGTACFFIMLWFFGMYGSWHAPIHKIHGDEPHYLLMAHSLVTDGNLNLHNQYADRAYHPFYSGTLEPKPSDSVAPNAIYSRGLGAVYPVIISPFYALGGYQAVQVFTIVCAALLIAQLYLLVLSSGVHAKYALLSVVLIASSSPILNYSSLVYPDIPAALLVILGLRALQISPSSKAGRSVPTYIFLVSTILIFTKFRYFIPVLLLIIPLAIREVKRLHNGLVLFFSIGLLGVSYILADKLLLAGDLFTNRFGDFNRLIRYLPSTQSVRVIPGLLLDQESGLLIYAPLYFLVFAGIRLYKGKRTSTYWFAVLGVPLTAFSLLGHFAWHSLPTPPLRYLVPVLPPTALFLAISLEKWKQRSRLFNLTACASIFISWLHIWLLSLKPEWQINLADGTARIFTELSKSLKIPIPSFFPSVIRPNTALWPWLFLFILMTLVYTFPPWRDLRNEKRSRLNPVIGLLAVLFIFGLLIRTLSIQSYHFEDRFWIQADGGTFYPENRDPFHHQEVSYGWSFSPGTHVSVPLFKSEERFTGVVRCRLKDSWQPQKLHIYGIDSPSTAITVTSKNWMQYAFKLTPSNPISQIEFIAPDTNTSSIAIDNVKIIRKSPFKFNLWKNIGHILQGNGFYKMALYCSTRALLVAPGDPWNELSNYFHPTTKTRKPKFAELYPFSESFLIDIKRITMNAGWERTHVLENMFNFSIRFKLSESQLMGYAEAGVLTGHLPSVIQMSRLDIDDTNDSDLRILKAISYYLRGNIPESAKQLDNLLIEGNHYPMRLSAPSSQMPVSNQFYPLLSDMENNSTYRFHANLNTNHHLVKSIQAYHNHDYQIASEYFDSYYLSDHHVFMETIPEISSDYASKMLERANRIHRLHVIELINKSLENQNADTALAAAEYGLRMTPDNPEIRQQKARAFFNKGELQQSRLFCLENVSLNHADDYSRWLLQTVNKHIRRMSCELSSQNNCTDG